MRLTTGTLVAALGLASGAKAVPVTSPENPVPVLSVNATANATALLAVREISDEGMTGEEARAWLFKYGSTAPCQAEIHTLEFAYTYGVMSNLRLAAVPDIGDTCDALWKHLRRFPTCAIIFEPSCGPHPTVDGILVWTFTVMSLCGPGMVGSAWWEATQNEFGSLGCVGVEQLNFE
ncbi:hypothetical protein LZ30DRAFT_817936 [Colletotrichum cereale]|nr:hypothetical protein LZ30DRAFT_817936 [Colletotrichum cereale]